VGDEGFNHQSATSDRIGVMNLLNSVKNLSSCIIARKGSNDKISQDNHLQWTNSIDQVDGLLDRLIEASGKDFLRIAENLQEYYTRAQKMCDKSSEVVEIMTGEALGTATDGLQEILEELKDHINESQGHFSQISNVFQQHRLELSKLSSSIESFKLHVLNLSMLGFLTRVENAHIFTGNTGFTTLTDDVRNLSDIIKQKSLHINQVSLNVQSFVTLALSKITHFERTQSDSARITLEKAVTNHQALSQKFKSASDSARLVEQVSKDIASSIGDIVISMQFHDITRQQLEHVKAVLDNLCVAIGKDDYTRLEKAAMVRDVLTLQHAQLKQSYEELANAVFKVIASLQNITKNVSDVLLETQDVAWGSDTMGQSFMEGIDSGITSVIECIKAIAEEHINLSGTVNSASEMVSEMSVFVKDIESLGLNLQLIALNARIKAAHLGKEGAMLDTISGSIYELSKNAREDTKDLSRVLATLVDISLRFKEDMMLMQDKQSKTIGFMVDKLRELIESLHSINDEVHAMLQEMTNLGESLLKDLQDTADEITVHEKVESVLRKVMKAIKDTAGNARLVCPKGFESLATSLMSTLDRLYTTKSERDIHVKHLESGPQDAAGSEKTNPGDDNWDNLELF
jgi:methyl-accepting chemotaxis protein